MWYSLNILPPYTVFHTIKKARSPWPQWGHRVRNSLLMRTEREKRNLLYRPIHIFNKNTHFTVARGGTRRNSRLMRTWSGEAYASIQFIHRVGNSLLIRTRREKFMPPYIPSTYSKNTHFTVVCGGTPALPALAIEDGKRTRGVRTA